MANQFDGMDPDYVSSVAERAEQLMLQNAVPATPSNYSVWFTYALGTSPSLRKTIDILIKNKRPFDRAINADLYEQFVNKSSAESSAPEQLNDVIENARRILLAAISDAEAEMKAAL